MSNLVNPYWFTSPPANPWLVDMIAWWSLDEAANVTRVDSHTNGYDLVDLYSFTGSAAAVVNNGTDTAGNTSAELSIPPASAPLLNPVDTDFTIAGWVKFDALTDGTFVLGRIDDPTAGYMLGFNVGGGVLAWQVKGTQATFAASTATWYQFVAYHDSVANEIGLIIDDGTPTTTAHTTGIDTQLVPAFLHFKLCNLYNSPGSFDGQLDEVGVWGRLLTSAEITALAAGMGYPG